MQRHRRPISDTPPTSTTTGSGARVYHAPPDKRPPITRFFQDWFWWLLKNVLGWALILLAPVLGVIVPGPGGLPIFLIGFALVTFPGKRRLTARILYGRPLPLSARLVSWIAGVLAVTVPAVIFWWLARGRLEWVQELVERPLRTVIPAAAAGYLLTMVVVWLLTRLILWVTNSLIRLTPKVRRRMRPWLRRHGINLLPPRGTRRGDDPKGIEQEIIEFHPRHQERLQRVWKEAKPWLRRGLSICITAWIAVNIYGRLSRGWNEEIRRRVVDTSIPRLLLASVMFAGFLLFFRALVWRRILKRFGTRLPVAATVRVWSLSELARYLPGVIWQVLGRAYLLRPYGVSGSVSSTSQLMELGIFILANVLVATACIPWFAGRLTADAAAVDHGVYIARAGLIAAVACVPVLLTLLVPKVFYGLMDRVMRALGKDPFPKRLPMKALLLMLGWNVLGLMWQTLALWVMLSPAEALGLKFSKFPLIAGAYCLAWFIGFIAFWAPGGIGVREIVLVATLRFALPHYVMAQFGDRASYDAFLLFIGMMLRLWTILGELILTSAACAADFKGMINRPNAPGRERAVAVDAVAS